MTHMVVGVSQSVSRSNGLSVARLGPTQLWGRNFFQVSVPTMLFDRLICSVSRLREATDARKGFESMFARLKMLDGIRHRYSQTCATLIVTNQQHNKRTHRKNN